MIVFGTRPEIIKIAPVVDACQRSKLQYLLVHTEQHYDRNMSLIFLSQLGVKPDYLLKVGSGTHAVQTARAMVALEKVMVKEEPDIILVEGDTNTGLAAGLAAVKLGIPVGHVEAGLRSRDLRMPEEHNRRLVDHISAYLFAPTKIACENLEKESVWGAIHLTGNTVIDACLKYMPIAERESKILEEVNLERFALATVHRAENVDDKGVLTNFVKVFTRIGIPVVFVAHPRTMSRLVKFRLCQEIDDAENVRVLPAASYFDFLVLIKNCSFILTDSGGIQEEATSPNIRKFVFVLRKSTERPEAVEAGFARVVGTDADQILREVKAYLESGEVVYNDSPYGDGKAGEHIVGIIKSESKSLTRFLKVPDVKLVEEDSDHRILPHAGE